MEYTLTDKQVAQLKKIAEEQCWSDDPEFLVDDYAGG